MEIDPIEWLSIVFRFVHVLAAIMWVGNSIYFNWLDGTLMENDPNKDGTGGDTWLIHGGGVYHVQKHRLDPRNFPPVLHWFKWESYSTWLSGFALICVMYYSRGGFYLLGGNEALSGPAAVGLGVVALIGGFLAYDLIWRSPLKNQPLITSVLCIGLLMGLSWFLCQQFNGRAAFIHIGGLLGTCMAGNVFFHIMPNQRCLVNAVKAGEEHSVKHGTQAKIRSKHNNYMTFPVIFIMLSSHSTSMLGHHLNWAVLGVAIAGLATIKHFMNIRNRFRFWLPAAIAAFVLAGAVMLTLLSARSESASAILPGEGVFTRMGCVTCHGAGPSQLGPSLEGSFGRTETLVDGSTIVVDEIYLRESILDPHAKVLEGYTPVMPPFAGVVTDEEVDQLVEYIKKL